MHVTAGLIHALPLAERRVFNRQEAASYVCVSPGHFTKLVNAGRMPPPIPDYGHAKRWDKAALDRCLDGQTSTVEHSSRGLSPYDQWKVANGQG